MCAIIGAIVSLTTSQELELEEANRILRDVWTASHARGRDGRGYKFANSLPLGNGEYHGITNIENERLDAPRFLGKAAYTTMIGNVRAEPTTEYIAIKHQYDQQPYSVGGWSIVHNGTIANDKELRSYRHDTKIDSAAIAEALDSAGAFDYFSFHEVVKTLKGSFAIIATNEKEPDALYVAANYRPIWYIETDFGVFFASAEDYFDPAYAAKMLEPYSTAAFNSKGRIASGSLYDSSDHSDSAVVVCSGGMDSVVAAAYAQHMGMKIHLLHFQYGSRAQGPEVKAVQAVAQALGAELTLFPLPVYRKGDSPLLDPDSTIAGGEAGAEFAHEWVPARNLVLLSVATAFAEARGSSIIVLGNNLEEAGAYPDNEPEFIEKFNKMLPFAVGAGKRMRVIMPVGNMMKHEIVALGIALGAPLHLTWSCYRAGEKHCGTCGPCFMRRTAFKINGADEVIEYEKD